MHPLKDNSGPNQVWNEKVLTTKWMFSACLALCRQELKSCRPKVENQATSTACFEPQACNNVQNVPLVFVSSTQQTFLARNGLHKLKQLLILQNSPLTTVRVHLQQRKQKVSSSSWNTPVGPDQRNCLGHRWYVVDNLQMRCVFLLHRKEIHKSLVSMKDAN